MIFRRVFFIPPRGLFFSTLPSPFRCLHFTLIVNKLRLRTDTSTTNKQKTNHQLYVGMMISKQPLYIKGIDSTNQEITKESAFGAMGMFIFLFSSSVVYLCYNKHHDEEHDIRSRGYMRPGSQGSEVGVTSRGGFRDLRMSDYQVEMPPSASNSPDNTSDDDEDEHIDLLS